MVAGAVVLPFDRPCLEPREIVARERLEEPSGLAYHAERRTLFAVGDEGDVVELDLEGGLLAMRRLGELDLEGITVGPGGRLYVAVEDPPEVLVLDPDTLGIERRYAVDRMLNGAAALCLTAGGGIEGICYVPEQGAFYVVNQLEPARLVELSLPADGSTASVKRIVAELDDTVRCASDLMWHAGAGRFLVTSSSYRERPGKLYELEPDGKVARERRLPGRDQEGFCLDAEGNAYVACDSGGILKCEPYRGE